MRKKIVSILLLGTWGHGLCRIPVLEIEGMVFTQQPVPWAISKQPGTALEWVLAFNPGICFLWPASWRGMSSIGISNNSLTCL
jgi:hypothetical protein